MSIASQVLATSVTIKLDSNEKKCLMAWSEKPGEVISLYFAVQQGGSFDIDFTVLDPNNAVVTQGFRESRIEQTFKTTMPGEYRFCFSNEMSAVTDKVIEVEITTENERPPELPVKQPPSTDTGIVDEPIQSLRSRLATISRLQKYFRTRENRNMSTVKSTESRIMWFSIVESLLVLLMTGLQVTIARVVFSFSRRTAVKV